VSLDDGGLTWQDIGADLPSEFGFLMVAHPRPDTVWAILLNADCGRYVPEGR
jgi:hypothetical protein